jgi:hypothetical protein
VELAAPADLLRIGTHRHSSVNGLIECPVTLLGHFRHHHGLGKKELISANPNTTTFSSSIVSIVETPSTAR